MYGRIRDSGRVRRFRQRSKGRCKGRVTGKGRDRGSCRGRGSISGSVKCRGRSMNRVRASCRWIRIRFSVGVGVR